MLNYNEIEFLTYERQAQFHARAEADRLVKAATASRTQRIPALVNHCLVRIGVHLVQWGRSLQQQRQPVDLSLDAHLQSVQ